MNIELLDKLTLSNGSHDSVEDGVCAMEAASYIAGEPFSDHPKCACPVITAFMISWNDSLSSNEDRDRLLKPLIPLTIGTRSTKDVEGRRSFACIDWLFRSWLPDWLDGVSDRYAMHTATLRAASEITSWDRLSDITPALVAVKNDAAAARDVAWAAAAWDAARDVAWAAAAGAAAWAVAWDAAWAAAAGAAAWAVAWDAAGAAARDAARDAAGAKPSPTVAKCQESASALVRRLCEMK